MSTWTGAALGATVGVGQGIVNGALSAVTGKTSVAEGYAAGQQLWMSMGDTAQNTVINYDAVEPSSVKNGDLMVMWEYPHTILVLVVNSKKFVVYEHCGEGFMGGGGPRRQVLEGDDAWDNLRSRHGGHNYILHHTKTNETKAHVDQIFNRLKPKYEDKYNMAYRNCHSFCDDMLVTMNYPAPGIYRTAAAQMRNA